MFNSAKEKGSNDNAEDIRQRMMRIKSIRKDSGANTPESSGPSTPIGTPTNESTLKVETPERKKSIDAEELKNQIAQQITLKQILTDEIRREIFKDFSEKENTLQNLLFLERCKKFKKIKDDDTRVTELLQISNLFLAKEADYLINVNPEAIKKVEKVIFRSQKISDTVFDELIAEVVENLQQTFLRFKDSEEFKKCF